MSWGREVGVGYDPAGLGVARLPDDPSTSGSLPTYEEVADRLHGLPSIVAVAGSDGRPLGGPGTIGRIGRHVGVREVRARMVSGTPGDFRALGIRLLGGRDFSALDTLGTDL